MSNVLLVGLPRSGTTWAGRMLGAAEGVTYVEEPDYVDADPDQPARHGFGPYPVLRPGAASARYRALWEVAFAGAMPTGGPLKTAGKIFMKLPGGVRDPLMKVVAPAMAKTRPKARTVVKSIHSLPALEWIDEAFDPAIVVIQRDPLNVVSSWLELDFPLYDLWNRADIRAAYVEPLGLPAPGANPLARTAWSVGVLAAILGAQVARRPAWTRLTHEALCVDPEPQYRRLFEDLGLEYGSGAEEFLARSNRPGTGYSSDRITSEQPHRWKGRLTPEQVAETRLILAGFPNQGWAWAVDSNSGAPATAAPTRPELSAGG